MGGSGRSTNTSVTIHSRNSTNTVHRTADGELTIVSVKGAARNPAHGWRASVAIGRQDRVRAGCCTRVGGGARGGRGWGHVHGRTSLSVRRGGAWRHGDGRGRSTRRDEGRGSHETSANCQSMGDGSDGGRNRGGRCHPPVQHRASAL